MRSRWLAVIAVFWFAVESSSCVQESNVRPDSTGQNAAASSWHEFGKAGIWRISGLGGQCQAGTVLGPGPGQFGVGVATDGTYLTFQNLAWQLPVTRRNVMPVEVFFDGSKAFETEALLIVRAYAFQIFLRFSDINDEEFWEQFLAAESIRVTGPFRPGSAELHLEDPELILPLLRKCAEEHLHGRKLPF